MRLNKLNILDKISLYLSLSLYFSLLAAVVCSQANAESLIQWQSSNIQLLRGSDYELTEPHGTIVTFEYVNQWSYGDFFMFIDQSKFDDGEKNTYGEISPRFSFNKLTGQDLSNGVIKDVYLSTTIEKGKGGVKAYLLGTGVDVDIPGFSFFNANIYTRHNPDLDDDTWQVTLAWQYPFLLGSTNWMTEGFADFAGDAESGYVSNQHIVPRLLIDVSGVVNMKGDSLWMGIEYSFWTNKYGVNGIDERAVQAQIKWVFL